LGRTFVSPEEGNKVLVHAWDMPTCTKRSVVAIGDDLGGGKEEKKKKGKG